MNDKVRIDNHPNGFVIRQKNKRLSVVYNSHLGCFEITSWGLADKKLTKKEIREYNKNGTVIIGNRILSSQLRFTKKTFDLLACHLATLYCTAGVSVEPNKWGAK